MTHGPFFDSDDGPRPAILDWSTTGLEGAEVCRRARATAGLNYVYMVILTSRLRTEDLVQAMEAGVDDCIAKPFCSQELQGRLTAGFRILRLQERLIAAREELYEQATRDGLTGIWNRRNIVEIVESEIARARRGNTPLAVVMADTDHFKRVNDTHGHFAGDAALSETARRLKATLRQYDSVGRFGGEEFLVVAPGCNLAASIALADRLRRSVAASLVGTCDGDLTITCSFGVAWSDGTGSVKLDQLLQDADAALYMAKRNGEIASRRLGLLDAVLTTFIRQSVRRRLANDGSPNRPQFPAAWRLHFLLARHNAHFLTAVALRL